MVKEIYAIIIEWGLRTNKQTKNLWELQAKLHAEKDSLNGRTDRRMYACINEREERKVDGRTDGRMVEDYFNFININNQQ